MLGKMVACSCLWGKEMQQEEDGQKAKSSKDLGGSMKAQRPALLFPTVPGGGLEFWGKIFPSVASH